MDQGRVKVGTLDDPIWQEPIPPVGLHEAKQRHLSRRGKTIALVGIVVVTLLATGIVLWQGRSKPGGDPTNAVYRRLRQVLIAIPASASGVRVGASTPTRWESGCPQIARAQSGWSQVYISVDFVDTGTPTVVADQISSALEQQGWVRHDTALGTNQGKVAHWLLDLHEGAVANAFVFRNASKGWFMSASWQPSGPVGEPCP